MKNNALFQVILQGLDLSQYQTIINAKNQYQSLFRYNLVLHFAIAIHGQIYLTTHLETIGKEDKKKSDFVWVQYTN